MYFSDHLSTNHNSTLTSVGSQRQVLEERRINDGRGLSPGQKRRVVLDVSVFTRVDKDAKQWKLTQNVLITSPDKPQVCA